MGGPEPPGSSQWANTPKVLFPRGGLRQAGVCLKHASPFPSQMRNRILVKSHVGVDPPSSGGPSPPPASRTERPTVTRRAIHRVHRKNYGWPSSLKPVQLLACLRPMPRQHARDTMRREVGKRHCFTERAILFNRNTHRSMYLSHLTSHTRGSTSLARIWRHSYTGRDSRAA